MRVAGPRGNFHDRASAVNHLIDVESSIPSFYFETRPGVQMQARREWTREWWQFACWQDHLVSSLWVIRELEDTPEPKRADCLSLMDGLRLLQSASEIDRLVDHYIENKVMPADADGDARHLAMPHFGNVIFSSRGTAAASPTPTRPTISAMPTAISAMRPHNSSLHSNFWK